MIFPWYDIGAFFSGDYQRDTPSFGGAVMWNKQTYFEIGGENEYFISFGPEDVERMERALALGIKIERVRGRLYHFNHWCGPDSSVSNPYFKKNRELLEAQRKMSVAELKDYINSWPWHSPYTPDYYEDISEGAKNSASIVLELIGFKRGPASIADCGNYIVSTGLPGSVIDIGGGVGNWNNGNPNYYCVDYRVPVNKLLIPADRYIECNLENDTVGGRYDLAICLEVLEHISYIRAEALVEMLCNLSDRVLFSAAIPYQGGNGHINEQWQTYWAELFYKNGYGVERQREFWGVQGVEL
jgi:hypothetical protein